MDLINLIEKCAEIPSFSTQEHRLHPFIYDYFSDRKLGEIELIHKNNLIIHIYPRPEDKTDVPLVALTAHMDKINHFDDPYPDKLPVKIDTEKITGQLDDSVGVGMCLSLAEKSKNNYFPRLLLLFSEMEEHGDYINPDEGILSGIGGARISEHLIACGLIPDLFITIDTTPFYRGTSGISLYSRFWDICCIEPTRKLFHATEKLENYFLTQFPEIKHQNNTNDYITYGKYFHTQTTHTVPSIALEPAIYPYHQKGEQVFLSDIRKIESILTTFLSQFRSL